MHLLASPAAMLAAADHPFDPTLAGFPKNQATFARVMGYCEQEDVHLPQVGAVQGCGGATWRSNSRE